MDSAATLLLHRDVRITLSRSGVTSAPRSVTFLLEGDSCPSPKFIDSHPNSQHLRWTVRGAWTFKEVIRVNGGRWGEGALTQHDCVLLRRKEDMDAGRTQRAGPREDVGRSQLCGRGGGAGPGPQASGSWALRGRSSVVGAAVWHAMTDGRAGDTDHRPRGRRGCRAPGMSVRGGGSAPGPAPRCPWRGAVLADGGRGPRRAPGALAAVPRSGSSSACRACPHQTGPRGSARRPGRHSCCVSSVFRAGESSRTTPEQSDFICCEVELRVNCTKLILIQIKPFISLCISAPRQTRSLLQLLHSK